MVSIIVLPTSSSHIPEVQPTSCDLDTVTPTCVKPMSPASYQLRYFLLVQCNLCLPNTMEHQKAPKLETSLIVQWLRLRTSPAEVRKKDSTCWAARPKDKLQNLGNYIRNPSQDIVLLCLNTMNSQENQKFQAASAGANVVNTPLVSSWLSRSCYLPVASNILHALSEACFLACARGQLDILGS